MESWEQFPFPKAKKKVKRESNKFRSYVQFYAELLYKSIVTEQGVCCIVCRTLHIKVLRFWFQSKTIEIEAKILLLGSAKRGIFACFASKLNSKKRNECETMQKEAKQGERNKNC